MDCPQLIYMVGNAWLGCTLEQPKQIRLHHPPPIFPCLLCPVFTQGVRVFLVYLKNHSWMTPDCLHLSPHPFYSFLYFIFLFLWYKKKVYKKTIFHS